MNGSDIYKRLAGGEKKPISNIIGHVLAGVLIYFTTAFVFLATTYIHQYYVLLSFSIAFITVPPYAWYAIKKIKMAARKIQKRHEMIESMSELDFYKLDSQVMEGWFYYGTFYFLDEYMYVPKKRLLIKYKDIIVFDTKLRGKRYFNYPCSEVYIILVDEEDLVYKIKVKKWKEYLNTSGNAKVILSQKIMAQEGKARALKNYKGW